MKIKVKGKEYVVEDMTITGNTADERETDVILMSDEKKARIYTSDGVYFNKFKKNILANPDNWKIISVDIFEGNIRGVTLEAPKSLISFRKKSCVRELSDEQREAIARGLHKFRSTGGSKKSS